jgi:hypothetical protein
MGPGASGNELVANIEHCLPLAARHLLHAMKLADLYDSHNQLRYFQNLQRALFAITDLSVPISTYPSFFAASLKKNCWRPDATR